MKATYGNLPMFNSSLFATLVIGPVSDITKRIDMLLAFNLKVFIDRDTLVFLQLEAGVGKECGCRFHTGSHNDDSAGNVAVVLDDDGSHLARVGL